MTQQAMRAQAPAAIDVERRARWLLLGAVMTGLVAAVMTSTIFNVAVPDLSRHFGIGQARAQWIFSSFMAANTSAMLTTPWLLARFGYRHVCYGAMALLMTGALAGVLASSFPAVLLARVVQGIGSGLIMPVGTIIIMHSFPASEQGRVSALYTLGVVLVPAVAPTIGGVLVDWLGWRAIFAMSVPFCLLALWLARRHIPQRTQTPGTGASLDWIGLVLASATTVLLLNGLVRLQSADASPAPILGTALACLLAFLGWQLRVMRDADSTGRRALVNLALFRHRHFALGCVVVFTYGASLYGSVYLFPVYLQVALGLSPAVAGAMLMPSSLLLAASVALAGRYADRQPPHRMVSGGLAVLTASFVLMALLEVDSSLYWMLAFTVLGRTGLGFVLPSLNLGAMRSLPAPLLSYASSSLSFLQMVGGSLGVSLCGVALQWRLAAHGAVAGTPVLDASRLAAFNEVFMLLAGVCLVAVLAALGLRPPGVPE